MKLLSKVILGFVLTLLVVDLAFGTVICDANYDYTRSLNITTTEALTNAQIPLHINGTEFGFANTLANGFDIRIYDTGCSEVQQFRQYYNQAGTDAYIWINDTFVKGVNQYYVNYGYPSATDASDSGIFYEYDSLETQDAGKWTVTEGGTSTITAQNNTVQHYGRNTTWFNLDSGQGDSYLRLKPTSVLTGVTASVWWYETDSGSHNGIYPENTTTWADDPSYYNNNGDDRWKEDGSDHDITGVSNALTKWVRISLKQNATGLYLFKTGNNSLLNQQADYDAGQTFEGYVVGDLNGGANTGGLHLSDFIVARESLPSSVVFGAESQGAGITLNTPNNNDVIYGSSVDVNFTIVSNNPSVNMSLWVNGSLNHTQNYTVTNDSFVITVPTRTQGGYELKIGYTNGSDNVTANVTVNLFQLNSTTDLSTGILESANVNYYIYINNYSADFDITPSVRINGTVWNATLYDTGTTNITYLAQITMPSISTSAETISINTSVEFNFGSYTLNQTLNQTVTVFQLLVNNCTGLATGNTTMIFNARYEINNSVAGSMDYEIRVAYNISDSLIKNFSYSYDNVDTASLCIYPPNQTIYADIDVFITKDGFDLRTNVLRDVELTNETQYSTTFLITDTNGSLINFDIVDEYNNPVEDIVLRIQRYFFENTSWIDVTATESNALGKTSAYLEPYNVQYRFLLYDRSGLVKDYDPIFITESTYELSTVVNFDIDFTTWKNTQYDCTWNNITKIYRCTGTDPTGVSRDWRLAVTELKLFGASQYCDNSATGSAVTILCDLSSITNATEGFNSFFYVTIDGKEILRVTERIEEVVTQGAYGLTGVLLTFMITITMVLIASWNPVASMVAGLAGIFIAFTMGLLTLNFSSLVILTVGVVFIIAKMRS